MSDLNKLFTGITVVDAATGNNPFGDWCMVIAAGDSGTGVQRAYRLYDGAMMHRSIAAGKFTAWTTNLAGGKTDNINCEPGKITEYQVIFPAVCSFVPKVVATLYSGSSSIKCSNLTLTVYKVSKTGFTIRLYNGSDALLIPSVEWIAVS